MLRALACSLLVLAASCGDNTPAPPPAGTAAYPGPEWESERAPGEPWEPIQTDESRLRWRMSEEEVLLVFQRIQPGTQYDPLTYWSRIPNKDLRYGWGERPEGEWRLRTNASGLRDDDEVRVGQPGLRVLVTGDSHTDGVCFNEESYANRLEAHLGADDPERTVEVLNAGVGGYTFFHFHGVLRKFLPLRPDVFVIGVYGGNDFLENLRPHHFFGETPWVEGLPHYRDRMEAGRAVRNQQSEAAIAQALNQVIYFATHPAQMDHTLGTAFEVFEEIQSLCAEHEVRLLVMYIPPPWEVQGERFRGLYEAMSEAMQLGPDEYALGVQLGDRLLAGLNERSIETLDLRTPFREHPELLYWGTDHHINLLGHALAAELLHERLSN